MTPGRKFSSTTSALRDQAPRDLDPLGMLEIHGDRLLADIGGDERRRHAVPLAETARSCAWGRPASASSLMTSAPSMRRKCEQNGPAMTWLKSATR